MRETFANLKSRKVMEFFYDISQIPRGSGNEIKISQYLETFAKDRGLFYIRYKNNNVMIRKPASAGKEDIPGVILQSHMDMVCEKNRDTVFNFENDSIDIYVEGDFIKAKGTTLGADNGIGVAMTLAVLDSNSIAHPQIEGIFTVDEERGLTGAMEFDATEVTGKTLINLDSEEDDEILTSCAGGVRINHALKYKRVKRPSDTVCADIVLKGLQGGHSGMDITKGRANANRLLGRVLYAASREMKMNIVDISGGSKDNAIPREAFCRLTLEKGEKENLEIIRKSGLKANELVKRLMSFKGRDLTVFGKIDLVPLLKDAVELSSHLTGDINIKMELSCSEAFVMADRTQMEQVFLNLLVNAAEAINGSGNKDNGEIVISLKKGELAGGNDKSGAFLWHIIISDNGPGIKREIIDTIFDPFVSSKDAGSGLGLAIVNSLITEHEGIIEVDSGPGGARFDIYIPAADY